MPRDGHGQASTGWGFLAAGLGLGIFRAPSQCALSDLGFSSARNNFHPLQFPRGLVRKGKKCCQRFSPSLPKCKPLGSPAGIWQPQECVGTQETSGQGLGVCVVKRNISLRTSLRHTHPQVSEQNCPCRPPYPGFSQVRVLVLSSLGQGFAQHPWQGMSAAPQYLLIFCLSGREGVKLFRWKAN